MNILYTCSDLYASHMGVSMISLFENNKDLDDICVYILEDNICQENKIKLKKISRKYGREIVFIDGIVVKKIVEEANAPSFRGSYIMCGKLFPDKFLPNKVHDVLFIDAGDTIITGSLKGLLNFDMKDYAFAAVQITTFNVPGENYDNFIARNRGYYNDGVLWINLDNWRKNNCSDIIKNQMMKYPHFETLDQTIINAAITEKLVLKLPLEYNYTGFARPVIERDSSYTIDNHYSLDEVKYARKNAIITHWPGAYANPWIKGSIAAKKGLYWKYRRMSPWAKEPINVKIEDCFSDSNLIKREKKIFWRRLYFYFPYIFYPIDNLKKKIQKNEKKHDDTEFDKAHLHEINL